MDLTHAPAPIEPESVFSGLSTSAIVRGAILDVVLTVIASIPLTLGFVGSDAFSENEEVANRAFDQAFRDPMYLFAAAVVGLTITVYAAYWAARRAKTSHLRHGGWTAVASAATSSLFLLLPGVTEGPGTPLWYDALGLLLMLPAGIVGGWFAFKLHPTVP